MENDPRQLSELERQPPSTVTTGQLVDPDFYKLLSQVSSIHHLKFEVLDILKCMGLTDFMFRWSTPANNQLAGWGTLPKDLRKLLLEERCAKQDIATRYLFKTGSPVFISDLEAEIYNRRVIDDSSAYTCQLIRRCYFRGYPDIYHMQVKMKGANTDIICSFAAEHCEVKEFRRRITKWCRELTYLANAVVSSGRLRIGKAIQPGAKPKSSFEPNELDIVRTMAYEDLSLKDAATKLGISTYLANKHFTSVKKKLAVRTQAVVIYRAWQKGLI